MPAPRLSQSLITSTCYTFQNPHTNLLILLYLQLLTLLISQLFLLVMAHVSALATLTMLSWSSVPAIPSTFSQRWSCPKLVSWPCSLNFFLSLLWSLPNASDYFSHIFTMKLFHTMEQSCPQFTPKASSILYVFGLKKMSNSVIFPRKKNLVLWNVSLHGIFYSKWEHLRQMVSNGP